LLFYTQELLFKPISFYVFTINVFTEDLNAYSSKNMTADTLGMLMPIENGIRD